MSLVSTRRRIDSHAGQTMLMMAFALIVVVGLVGLAIDTAVGYLSAVSASRAAEAGALSGVVFMPDQFKCNQAPATGQDAKERAWAEAQRNGFWAGTRASSGASSGADSGCPTFANATGHATDQVTVYSSAEDSTLQPNEVKVRVQRQVPVFFLGIFGFKPYSVVREAVADYLPPIALGQPGNQQGSAVSDLDKQPFILRTEGWATDRGQGDAFTPNPQTMSGVTVNSQDVHAISGLKGAEITTDASLWDRGGYNYRITVPKGVTGHVQVYNAAFSPDGNGKAHDYCDNFDATAPPLTLPKCNMLGGNYYMHEDDGGPFSFGTAQNYSTMRYTVFRVNNEFIRSQDTELTSTVVHPIDAHDWFNGFAPGVYHDVLNNCDITQHSFLDGQPINMQAFHQWMDVMNPVYDLGGADTCKKGNGNNGNGNGNGNGKNGKPLVTVNGPSALGSLGPGTYRLRIDTLDYQGNIPTSGDPNSGAHKGTGVRVVDNATGANTCASATGITCALAAWEDISIYTPVDGTGANSFACGPGCFEIPIFNLQKFYAGKTITFDMFDLGDISGGGRVDLAIVPPSPAGKLGPVYTSAAGTNVCIYNLGVDRATFINKLPSCGQPPANGYCSDTTAIPVGASNSPGTVPCAVHNLDSSNNPVGGINNRAAYRGTSAGPCGGGGGCLNDNYWYHMEIPIDPAYNPKLCSDPLYAPDPTTCTDGYWHLRYYTNSTAGDTWTFAVGLKGSPLRLLKS